MSAVTMVRPGLHSVPYNMSFTHVIVGIAALLVAVVALAAIWSVGLALPRQSFEQTKLTADVQTEADRMAQAIREAQSIATAEPYAITLYTTADGHPGTEKVRYFLESSDLKQTIDTGPPTVLARRVRNFHYNVPLFTYVRSNTGETERVSIDIIIDAAIGQNPAAARAIVNEAVVRSVHIRQEVSPL